MKKHELRKNLLETQEKFNKLMISRIILLDNFSDDNDEVNPHIELKIFKTLMDGITKIKI